jgi:hypothetical protein
MIRRFIDGGYRPAGAELEDDRPDVGHGHGDGHGTHGGVRRFQHRGHRVEVVTRYQVTIDGEPWEQPIHVQHDGSVMYHGLPQYVVASAVELMRGVIDHSYEAPEHIRAAIRAAQEEA